MYTWIQALTDAQRHTVHSCKHNTRKIHTEAEGFHEQLSSTGHLQTQILELKRITTLSK